MGTVSKPQGKAMYVASRLDESWLLTEQAKLYKQSMENPDYVFRKLWGLVTDPRNLRIALGRVARNTGRRTAGVDGLTVRTILDRVGADAFVATVRAELRAGTYRPAPVRRVRIPKPGQPGKFRALGIPTVKDRVVQAALKNILEPIFEADFYPVSYGFRPGRSAHGALEHLRLLLRPKLVQEGAESHRRLPYQWAIEGDIKGCFDGIDHHALMVRLRRRVGDGKVGRLVLAFLQAGILSEGQFLRSDSGTPQGGILSPLLANIALGAIEERYERHVWPRRTPTLRTDPKAIGARAMAARQKDRLRGRHVLFPIRYADDFIILVSTPPGPAQEEQARATAEREKAQLAVDLKEQLHLELSEAKTLVTPVTKPMRFLGHHVRVRKHPGHKRMVSTAVIPKDRSQRLREIIKDHFRRLHLSESLGQILKQLNPVLRGWGHYYRHAWGAKHVFKSLDHYVWWCILRWMRKKHRRASRMSLRQRYGWKKPGQHTMRWRDGKVVPFDLTSLRVEPFDLRFMRPPRFANIHGEPGA